MYSSLCNFLFQVIIIAIYAGTEHTVSIALQMRSPTSWLCLLHIKNAVRGNEGLQPPINRLSHLRVKWYTRRLPFVFAHLHLDQDRLFPEVRRLPSVLTFFHFTSILLQIRRHCAQMPHIMVFLLETEIKWRSALSIPTLETIDIDYRVLSLTIQLSCNRTLLQPLWSYSLHDQFE
jgi:hypothetical protein